MPTAEIGRWEFLVPEGWELKDQGIGVSYLEAPDGTKGMYSKTINSDPVEPSARSLAEYIQRVHRGGFEADPEADWSVMEFTGVQEGDLYSSRLLTSNQPQLRPLATLGAASRPSNPWVFP